MTAKRVKSVAAILLIIAAAISLYLTLVPSPPKPDARLHEALGRTLAQEAAKALGSSGHITLIAPDPEVFISPAARIQIDSFEEELRKTKLSVTTTNLVKLDPLRLLRVPPGDFFEVLRKRSEGDVVVSLLGPPLLTAEQRARLPAKTARIIAVCSGDMPRQTPLKALFEQELLHVAIVNRRQSPVVPRTDNTAEWFAYGFQLITPANVVELPSPDPSVPRL